MLLQCVHAGLDESFGNLQKNKLMLRSDATKVFPMADHHKNIQNQKLYQLKMHIYRAEKQISDQALLRQKLEKLVSSRLTRTNGSLDRISSNRFPQKWVADGNCGNAPNNHRSTRTKFLAEVLAKRTREFHQSQAEKAAKIMYLTQERQRILEAHNQLRKKHITLDRVPSPVGPATARMWDHKYSIYTPLQYDPRTQVYAPAFQDGYYTYFPYTKRKRHWFNGSLLFVPTPLYHR